MALEETLRQLLITDTTVQSLVGERVWNVLLGGAFDTEHGNELPAALFWVVDAPARGVSHTGKGRPLRRARVQFDCLAADQATAVQVAAAVEAVLFGHRDDEISIVDSSFHDFPDPLAKRARRVIDFIVWIRGEQS